MISLLCIAGRWHICRAVQAVGNDADCGPNSETAWVANQRAAQGKSGCPRQHLRLSAACNLISSAHIWHWGCAV